MRRALVLSGGGNKGAFEIGALYHLIHEYHLQFDMFSGTSVGALNCAYLAQGADLQAQTERIDLLKERWFSIKGSKDLYRFNLINICGLFFGGSLCHPFGLKKMIHSLITPQGLAKGKPLLIPAVALEDGELYIADSRNSTDREDMLDFLLASASIPVYFPPVKIRNKHWVDGGLRDMTPLHAVLTEMPQEVVIITSYPISDELDPVFPSFNRVNHTLSVIHRVIDILTAEIGSNDLKIRKDKWNQINPFLALKPFTKMIVISPEQPFIESSIKFSPRLLRKYYDLGIKAAKNPHVYFSF